MLGRGEIDGHAYRVAVSAPRQRIADLSEQLDATATTAVDTGELAMNAGIEWMRGNQLEPAEIERLQAPLRALGEWYVSPGERFKRYDADSIEPRIELRPGG